MIAGSLFSANAYAGNYADKKFIKNLWDRKIKTGDEKRAKMLWTLFALEVWNKKAYTSG